MAAETIAAIATPPGLGGIGVVRISGPRSISVAQAVLNRLPEPRQAMLSVFRDHDGTPIDEGIALFYSGPRSFTGEDVLELQGHGGPQVMDLLLARCIRLGCRPARPGEFTERAFLNGKLDLAQAEAVADLIQSDTALGARLAMRSLEGALSRRVHSLTQDLIGIRVFLEATLDFPEEEIDSGDHQHIAHCIESLLSSIRQVLKDAQQGRRIRDGLNVVIAGPPNAGKSSLLNILSQSDAAIVTPIPGTTRDLLRVDVQIDGLPVHLTDTAGLRDSEDPIEQEGVKRARDRIADADLVLWVYDCTQGFAENVLNSLPADRPVALVRNKIDLEAQAKEPTTLDFTEIPFSALTGQGLDHLRTRLRDCAGVSMLGEGAFVARRRHLDALERALQLAASAQGANAQGFGPELVAWDLLAAQQALGEITGEVTSDDLLGRIFASFCIGK